MHVHVGNFYNILFSRIPLLIIRIHQVVLQFIQLTYMCYMLSDVYPAYFVCYMLSDVLLVFSLYGR